MSKHMRRRQVCALFVAYVVALQALLLPLSVAASGSFTNGLCSAPSADTSQGSGSRDVAGYVCAAGCGVSCCAQALDVPPGVIDVLVTEARPFAAALPIAPPIRSISKGPQIPRAPPA
jgi:hypothetical protein